MNSLTEEFGSRLLEFAPGQRGLRTQVTVRATMSDVDPDRLTMVASDATLDRYDEVIAAEGWRLENYRRNPVIQNSHQTEDILHTIGRAERTWVEGGALMQVWRFASAANPVAKVARDLYRGGFLNAASVGFVPLRWEPGSEEAGCRRRFVEQELVEVSAVAIPANPNALALGLKAGAVDRADLRELAQLVKHFGSQEGTWSQAGATGLGADFAQLLGLARRLHEALRW